MLSLVIYPLLLYVWYFIGNYLYYNINNGNFKLSRTHVSVIHASSVVISYLFGMPGYILYYWSLTYYMMDTLYELADLYRSNKSIKLYELGMLLHHVISIIVLGYLWSHHTEKHMYYAYYLAELSNFPMYLVHHLKTVGYNNKYMLKVLIFIEAVAFIFLRLVLGSMISFEIMWLEHIPIFMKISSIILLIISLVWTNKLIRQLLM